MKKISKIAILTGMTLAFTAVPAMAKSEVKEAIDAINEATSTKIESMGVTESDCIAFAQNFKKIQQICEKANIDPNNPESAVEVAKVEAKIQALGISGPNAIYKAYVIPAIFQMEYSKRELNSNAISKAIAKGAGLNTNLTQSYAESDVKAIKAQYKTLHKAIMPDTDIPEEVEETEAQSDDEFKNELKQAVKDEIKKEVKKSVKEEAKRQTKNAVRGLMNSIF